MLCWWVLVCRAASPTDTDPLPALEVERPLTWPRGWTLAAVTLGNGDGQQQLLGQIRYGVMRGLEWFVEGGIAREHGLLAPSDPEFGARIQILRQEPPNTSAAIELLWRAPWGGRPETGDTLASRVLFSRQFGPCRLGAGIGPELTLSPHTTALQLGASLDGLLQLGPIAPLVSARGRLGTHASASAVEGGLLAQVSRGFAVRGTIARPLSGSDRSPLARSAMIGAEVAF